MSSWFVLVLVGVVACSRAPHEAVPDAALTPAPLAAAGNAPLRDWMKAELMHPLAAADFERLSNALTTLGGYAPPELERWAALAADGALAARHHDLEGVRVACAACHRTYRARYRDTLRARPLVAREGTY